MFCVAYYYIATKNDNLSVTTDNVENKKDINSNDSDYDVVNLETL